MVYKHRNFSSLPTFQDGDIVYDSNFASDTWVNIDQGKHVRFINCNLLGCTTTLEQRPEDGNLVGYPITSQPEEVQVYPELAAGAEIVLNALKGSGRLTPEQIVGLEQLAATVKLIAGTDAEIGEVATQETIKMIDTLRALGHNDFADMVEESLHQIQAGWEV